MGKLAPLLSHTVNSPVTVVKHVVTRREQSGFVLRCMMTRLWQQSIFQANAHQETPVRTRQAPLTCSPMFRYRKPMEPLSPSSSCFSVPPISTMHRDSGCAGRACILSGCKQSCQRQKRGTTPVSKAWHGKTGFKLHLRSLKMPF